MPLSDTDTLRSPGWWLLRLGSDLRERQRKQLDKWDRYFTGDHPLPQAAMAGMTRSEVDAWLDFTKKARTNLCPLPVDAQAHRQMVIGINDGRGREDKVAWSWWQRNRMDARQKQVYRLKGRHAWAYVMTGPHPADARRPLISIEHPSQVIVEKDAATGETVAGLKAWWDDIDGVGRARVWVAADRRKFSFTTRPSTARGQRRTGKLSWSAAAWTLDGDEAADEVPIEEFARLVVPGSDPVPAFHPMIDTQDRMNLTVLNRLSIERHAAMPQTFATGAKVKKEFDPLTGLERPVNPYPRSLNGTWVNENPEGRFGVIPAADTTAILKAAEADMRIAVVQTATPIYMLPLALVNVSTDTVMALGENLIALVNELNLADGECWERVTARCARIAGDNRDFSEHEVRYKDPRQINPAVIADMGTKYRSMGWPLAMVAERLGESPAAIERLRVEAAAEQLTLFGQQQGQDRAAAPRQVPDQLELAVPSELLGLV